MESAGFAATRRGSVEPLLTAAALALAAGLLVTTLIAIANFAWLQPVFDQLRFYETYLSLPFPQNVVQLDNGHRPMLPALVRVAEITWFGADQRLQIGFAVACALTTAALIAGCGWRERGATAARAAAVLATVVAVFWLANARILMHGTELVHVHLVSLGVTVAALGVWQAHAHRTYRGVVVATLACAAAMFSFGTGVASFAAVLVLMVALRLPRRWLLIPLAALAVCLLLYLAVLPGNDGVRRMVAFQPLASLLAGARWLSSPWIVGWLGLADPPLYDWLAEPVCRSRSGMALCVSARLVDGLPGADWRTTTSALIGLGGLAVLATAVIARLRRWDEPTRLETVALTFGLFAAACAGIIGLGRLDYLQHNPAQLFADRYLIWPCLFWMSLALLGVSRVLRRGRGAVPAAVLVCLVTAMTLPTQRAYAHWAAAVQARAERFAAAVRSGVVDAATLPPADDADPATVARTLSLLRERRLAMFAAPWSTAGERWEGRIDSAGDAQVRLLSRELVSDAADGRPALYLRGVIERGLADDAGPLVFLDADARIRGYAQRSFIAPDAAALRLDMPAKRGFDGYIAGFDATQTYVLVQWNADGRSARELLRLTGN